MTELPPDYLISRLSDRPGDRRGAERRAAPPAVHPEMIASRTSFRRPG
ncbi:hypothetical protein HBB16_15270 [Pseudonocardia sp. MCCB 268]|nr:hypothetical protein [Pseudonocardia cytotoxica]